MKACRLPAASVVLVVALLWAAPAAEAKYIFDVSSRRAAPKDRVLVSGRPFGRSTPVIVSLVADRPNLRRWPTTVGPRDSFHHIYPLQNLRGQRHVLAVGRARGRSGEFRASIDVPRVSPGRYGLELCLVPHFCQITGRFTVLESQSGAAPTRSSGLGSATLAATAALASVVVAARRRSLGNGSRFTARSAPRTGVAASTGPSSWR